MGYEEKDYLMMSGIQHFCFCERQWALIHMDQVWEDDSRTVSGNIFHERPDEGSRERRGDTLILRGVRVSSSELGLSGICDVVEFKEDPDGIAVKGMDGRYKVVPVEYKVGGRKANDCDRVQLCAEAMALEESIGTVIGFGCLFYGKERRREVVTLGEELRRKTCALSQQMHKIYKSGLTPIADYSPKCRGCSLFDLCSPSIGKGRMSVADYLKKMELEQ